MWGRYIQDESVDDVIRKIKDYPPERLEHEWHGLVTNLSESIQRPEYAEYYNDKYGNVIDEIIEGVVKYRKLEYDNQLENQYPAVPKERMPNNHNF